MPLLFSLRMNDDIRKHVNAIDACNQRGDRMLSIVDLIDAGTLTRDLAAYALGAIGKGASFMVGALPGGAGKTTVMGALLNCVPAGVPLRAADSLATIDDGLKRRDRSCYICHEIGDGGYYAYLWGGVLRRYFELPSAGHMLATNLHADTYEQAHRQICQDNGVSEEAFRQMNLLLFLSLVRTGGVFRRRIATVWESDGASAHRPIVAGGKSGLVTADEITRAAGVIDKLMASGIRTIVEVREVVVGSRPYREECPISNVE